MPESRTVCSFRSFYRTVTPIYTRLQSIDITNWSLEPPIHPASSISVNGPFLYFADVRLVQESQTRGPRAACGPRGHFVRPATHFGIFHKLTIIIHFFLLFRRRLNFNVSAI